MRFGEMMGLALASALACAPLTGLWAQDKAPFSEGARAQAANNVPSLRLAGIFCADGLYRDLARLVPLCSPGSELKYRQGRIEEEVPPWVNLNDPREVVIEDYAPPARAAKPLSKKSRQTSVAQSVVKGAYGLKVVLHSPTHVAIDSRRRLIIADPSLPALQILDGSVAVRIPGGPERRLQHPNGVATDAEDNIYVADNKVGAVLVYDADGQFLRYLGGLGAERPLVAPGAVAIDRKQHVLYVLDSAASELVLLDFGGKVLKRLGGRRRLGGVTLDFPSELALRGSTLAVLDGFGSRLQFLDLEGNLRGGFRIGLGSRLPKVPEMGLALDDAGNVYLSNGPWHGVRVYAPGGRLLASFGRDGSRANDFYNPSGMAVDSAGRIYVADTGNNRVQVFDTAPPVAAGDKAAPTDTVSREP